MIFTRKDGDVHDSWAMLVSGRVTNNCQCSCVHRQVAPSRNHPQVHTLKPHRKWLTGKMGWKIGRMGESQQIHRIRYFIYINSFILNKDIIYVKYIYIYQIYAYVSASVAVLWLWNIAHVASLWEQHVIEANLCTAFTLIKVVNWCNCKFAKNHRNKF